MDPQYRKAQYCWDCGRRSETKYLLYALDRYWHTACLKCSICRITLADAGSSCYTRAGLILCRDDYLSQKTNSSVKLINEAFNYFTELPAVFFSSSLWGRSRAVV
ncbi:hypothetical protein CEXT_131641 [Caerostris extrusa]|uniref:LIM zinc-binding domain-containing protein n=1 Tax=Caerostris extrusa TaxID=172846 RepID=A0AAV4QPH9_CAEEX|nr:hypothetical protein CEXT_131641 [Caerostris extrusa]